MDYGEWGGGKVSSRGLIYKDLLYSISGDALKRMVIGH
jgi:hypothetical protein